jgi:hypothetical protein
MRWDLERMKVGPLASQSGTSDVEYRDPQRMPHLLVRLRVKD